MLVILTLNYIRSLFVKHSLKKQQKTNLKTQKSVIPMDLNNSMKKSFTITNRRKTLMDKNIDNRKFC